MKNHITVWSLLALAVVSCTQDKVDFDSLVDNYAVVTIPAPDLTGITDNGKEVLKLYRMAADPSWILLRVLRRDCMPRSTTAHGTVSMGNPS